MINSILNLFCDYVSIFYVVVKVLIITVLPSQSCKILPGSVINHRAGFWLLISLHSRFSACWSSSITFHCLNSS